MNNGKCSKFIHHKPTMYECSQKAEGTGICIPMYGCLSDSCSQVFSTWRRCKSHMNKGCLPSKTNMHGKYKQSIRKGAEKRKAFNYLGKTDIPNNETTDLPEIESDVFIPKTLCPFFRHGLCNQGATCTYLHPGINDAGFPLKTIPKKGDDLRCSNLPEANIDRKPSSHGNGLAENIASDFTTNDVDKLVLLSSGDNGSSKTCRTCQFLENGTAKFCSECGSKFEVKTQKDSTDMATAEWQQDKFTKSMAPPVGIASSHNDQ